MSVINKVARFLKNVLPSFLWHPIRAVFTAIYTPIRFSLATGHFHSSIRRRAVSSDGIATPWYCYPVNDLFDRRDFSNKVVLEFGGGQSSIWWAERSKSVVTIEADSDWFSEIKNHQCENLEIVHFNYSEIEKIKAYLNAKSVCYDVIIIDGHDREKIASFCHNYLAAEGLILADNSDRYDMDSAMSPELGARVDFYGFAPGVSLRHVTSLYFKNSCFIFSRDTAVAEIEN